MQLNVLNTELADFWKNQSDKLLSNNKFQKEKGGIFDDILNFTHTSGGSATTSIDFSLFDLPLFDLKKVPKLILKEHEYSLSTKEYAKLCFITLLPRDNVFGILQIYSMLLHTCAFLNSRQLSVLAQDNMENFFISYINQSVNEHGFYNRLAAPGYKSSVKLFKFIYVRNELQGMGVTGVFSKDLSIVKINKTLNDVCKSQLNITLNEYRKGGSFNFLGLELGQYYVDFLRLTYEEDYFYTLICRKAFQAVKMKFKNGWVDDSASEFRLKMVLLRSVLGEPLDKSQIRTNSIHHEKLYTEMLTQLFYYYTRHINQTLSLSNENIEQLTLYLGLDMRFDAVEVIRVLMLQKYHPFQSDKTPEAVWQGYLYSVNLNCMDNEKLLSITVEDVYLKMSEIVSSQQLTLEPFIASFNCWANKLNDLSNEKTWRGFIRETERVSGAMCSLIVAWLGYRQSEFGFPLSAIYIEKNLDILDLSYVPFRFKLLWVVPKTNGATKIAREITSQCYLISAQLNELFQPDKNEPCLYERTGRHKRKAAPNESGRYIGNRVKANWTYFVNLYQPFNEVLEFECLTQKNRTSLTENEEARFIELNRKYDFNSPQTLHLLDTSKEVKKDLPILLCTGFFGETQKAFKKSLIEFSETGHITDPTHKGIIKKYLSGNTITWLKSDHLILDLKAMKDISNELVQGVRYPSSHSFRHIWAEAVLTRYQGDVGAVIRHQFCHLDNSFFMAYLRDKEPKLLIKSARIRVLNSIVDTLLLDSKLVDEQYSGGFSRYVRKVKSLTKAVSKSDLLLLRERLNGRIISIQSSHFSTCIPREGAERRAKCFEGGSINPQNAKPDFCLGCTNALITEGNLRGIWLTIQPMVKESLDDKVMGFMVESHLPTLRSAYKRIKELKTTSNEGHISKILPYIEKAIASIRAKLIEEVAMYGS